MDLNLFTSVFFIFVWIAGVGVFFTFRLDCQNYGKLTDNIPKQLKAILVDSVDGDTDEAGAFMKHLAEHHTKIQRNARITAGACFAVSSPHLITAALGLFVFGDSETFDNILKPTSPLFGMILVVGLLLAFYSGYVARGYVQSKVIEKIDP